MLLLVIFITFWFSESTFLLIYLCHNSCIDTFHISAMDEDILKFNPESVGYYIVKYDDQEYKKIAARLLENHKVSNWFRKLFGIFVLEMAYLGVNFSIIIFYKIFSIK